jgi:YfiR/HmsC-like
VGSPLSRLRKQVFMIPIKPLDREHTVGASLLANITNIFASKQAPTKSAISNRLFGILLLCTALSAVTSVSAQTEAPTEYEVKAAFIHNIAKFVEWPATAHSGDSLKLCILGHDSFGSTLNALRGKPVGDKVWEVLPANQQINLRKCRVLFIAASESGNLRQILDNIKGEAVLTVGDTDGYAEQGVIINFYLEQNRVRFEINNDAAGRAKLKISSQLLKLARIVAQSGGIK